MGKAVEQVGAADVAAVVAHVAANLEAPSDWHEPDGYPQSLALCVIDSIWSISSNYDTHVVPVLRRYSSVRGGAIKDCTDGTCDLVRVLDENPEVFANRQKVASGVPKSEVVAKAARGLCGLGVDTTSDLLMHLDQADDDGSEAERLWLTLPSQRSGITWSYLLMLSGIERVKPDRMVLRFLKDATGKDLGIKDAEGLLAATLERIRVEAPETTLRALDHAIWAYQRSAQQP